MLKRRERIRNNWYQRDSFFASSFALVSSQHHWSGKRILRPYQLVMPQDIEGSNPTITLVTRLNAATADNIIYQGSCTLNYVEFDSRERIEAITQLGNPFLSADERNALNPFTYGEDGTIQEAVQAIRCLYLDHSSTERATYIELSVEDIYVDERWFDGGVPNLPITIGSRNGNQMWFAEMREPFFTQFQVPQRGEA